MSTVHSLADLCLLRTPRGDSVVPRATLGDVQFADGTSMMLASGVAADSFSDPENARIIYLVAGGLVFVAVALAVGTVWWWRSSKTEHPALGPLEVMGSRRWWRSDYNERVRRLQEARPDGSQLGTADEPAAVPVDLQSLVRNPHDGYDDLLDDDARAAKLAAAEAAAAAELHAASVPSLAELAAAAHVVSAADAEPGSGSGAVREQLRDRTPDGGVPIDPLLRTNTADA